MHDGIWDMIVLKKIGDCIMSSNRETNPKDAGNPEILKVMGRQKAADGGTAYARTRSLK